MRWILLAIIFERMFTQSVEGHAPQIAGGNDPVGVNIIKQQRNSATDYLFNFLHFGSFFSTLQLCDAFGPHTSSRTSVTAPLIAAAATIAGLISSVRPV